MSPDFSQELQDRLIRYIEKYYGLTISSETADEFLDSMGEFCLWISNQERARKSP